MFAKKPGTEPSAVANRTASSGSTFSVLGSDTTIKGDIDASADLHVDGRVEGDIRCSSIVQGEGSEIFGAVAAESARMAGRVEGSISARELVILKTAHVRGDVEYDALTIEQGAIVDGKLSPRGARSAPDVGTSGIDTVQSGVDDLLQAANAAE